MGLLVLLSLTCVGGIVLAKVARGEIDQEQFRDWLDQALIRADDRALFGLSPRLG